MIRRRTCLRSSTRASGQSRQVELLLLPGCAAGGAP